MYSDHSSEGMLRHDGSLSAIWTKKPPYCRQGANGRGQTAGTKQSSVVTQKARTPSTLSVDYESIEARKGGREEGKQREAACPTHEILSSCQKPGKLVEKEIFWASELLKIWQPSELGSNNHIFEASLRL